MSTKTLGDVIRTARVAKELGLREFARIVGKTPSYLSDIENDRRVPAEDVLRQIAHELNLSFDELMALGGRLGEEATDQIRRNPALGRLFRRVARAGLGPEDLQKLERSVDRLKPRDADES